MKISGLITSTFYNSYDFVIELLKAKAKTVLKSERFLTFSTFSTTTSPTFRGFTLPLISNEYAYMVMSLSQGVRYAMVIFANFFKSALVLRRLIISSEPITP